MLKRLNVLMVGILCATSFSIAHAEPAPLRVGATPTAVPFNFLDPKTNTLRGAMIDVAEAVGKEAGYKTDVTPIPFASLVPSLQTNKIDLISSAFAKTPQRAQVVDFTQIVIEYGEALIVPSDDKTDYKSLSDLKGKTVGVQIGTLYVDPLKAVPGIKDVKMYDTMADLVRDVSLHRLDAAIGDGPVIAYQVHSSGASGVRYVDSYKSSLPTNIALAVRKGDDARRAQLDSAITKLKADGTIDSILKKWNVTH
ncbi:substrate-binding periplasmic protein [Paraburkholderia susongensis]|uniref:Amino acid ABC transporter substrate-binding protein, PAAT family n=1 Tax=Paraburkholderia susongensis TaxID=1515439 RepID=A0A1X7LPF8_9BURK|nr:ABC transporter substrate-binding protein [Paraburkholderia susongensis]SMG55715.1 amino acid ABC transporter substrate-binding protein, PAAT family [Paraburkholderia susongensis]